MTLQERLNTFEAEARVRIRRALSTGNERLTALDETLAKVSRDDFTVPAMRKQLEQLRTRAESLTENAMKRVQDMPADTVERLVSGTRAPVQSLARSLAEIAKRFEERPAAPAKRDGNAGGAE